LLHGGQIGTGVEQVAGVGAAKVVRGHGGQAGGRPAPFEQLTDGLAGHGLGEA